MAAAKTTASKKTTAKFAESGASGSTSSSGLSLDSLLGMLGK